MRKGDRHQTHAVDSKGSNTALKGISSNSNRPSTPSASTTVPGENSSRCAQRKQHRHGGRYQCAAGATSST
jgi:hypothetical protein